MSQKIKHVSFVIGCGLIGRAVLRNFQQSFSPAQKVVGCDRQLESVRGYLVNNRISTTNLILHQSNIETMEDISKIFSLVDFDDVEYASLVNLCSTRTANSQDFFDEDENASTKVWDEVLATNLTLAHMLSTQFARKVSRHKIGGSVVNVSSIYGADMGPDFSIYSDDAGGALAGVGCPAVYTCSKAAVVGLTKHLATKWANKLIRFNCVSPGGVFNHQDRKFVAKYSSRVPMGRMATPEEIAKPICFLMDQTQSSYITGQNLYVDGGLSSW